MRMKTLQTDTEVTTRQTEGGNGWLPMPGNSPQVKFMPKEFRRGALDPKSGGLLALANAARAPIRAAKGRRPTLIGAPVGFKNTGWPLVESIPQAFAGHTTSTAVALGGSPKTLYNKLNGCARDTAFSNS